MEKNKEINFQKRELNWLTSGLQARSSCKFFRYFYWIKTFIGNFVSTGCRQNANIYVREQVGSYKDHLSWSQATPDSCSSVQTLTLVIISSETSISGIGPPPRS